MIYPHELITSYRAHEITRAEFCANLAKLQHTAGVKSYADKTGMYLLYRRRTARITPSYIEWVEPTGQSMAARTIKEMKIKIDVMEAANEKWIFKRCARKSSRRRS